MEEYRDIIGYEGLYQVSNMGNVKSINYHQRGFSKILLPQKSRGYLSVRLSIGGIVKKYQVHRLVCLTFIDNPENKPQVNHIDGNKHNNNLQNLEWCTNSENVRHANLNNLRIMPRGEKHRCFGLKGSESQRALKINQYDLQGNFIKTWGSMIDVFNEIGISRGNLTSVCKGKRKTAGNFIWKYN